MKWRNVPISAECVVQEFVTELIDAGENCFVKLVELERKLILLAVLITQIQSEDVVGKMVPFLRRNGKLNHRLHSTKIFP